MARDAAAVCGLTTFAAGKESFTARATAEQAACIDSLYVLVLLDPVA